MGWLIAIGIIFMLCVVANRLDGRRTVITRHVPPRPANPLKPFGWRKPDSEKRGLRPQKGIIMEDPPVARIELGQKVNDTITDMEGTAVGRTEYLNGCIRILVQPRCLKDGVPVDAVWIDEPQLAVVEDTPAKQAKASGGPRSDPLHSPNPPAR